MFIVLCTTVRASAISCKLRIFANFNIFLQKLPDGKFYEFAYYEYHGEDYEGDMARLAAEQRNVAWLQQMDAMQIPLEGNENWVTMERIFFNP